MPDISDISKHIERKKQLDVNLPKYSSNLAGLYHRLSSIKLAMNYYMFKEQLTDNGIHVECEPLFESLNGVISNVMLNGRLENAAGDITVLNRLRGDITAAMEILTAYIDRFAIYEHIMNRVEFCFVEEAFDENYYENGLTNDIMHYILSDKDSAAINARICEIITQLPMRMSRIKFLESLKNGFSLYQDNNLSSLRDFVYMLKTAAGIYYPDGFDTRFPQLHDFFEILSGADYADIDQTRFHQLADTLQLATQMVTALADLYVNLMELVNDTYIILLTSKYAIADAKEQESCRFIIGETMNKTVFEDVETDINDHFIRLEGCQERLHMQISANDYVIDTVLDGLRDEAVNVGVLEDFMMLQSCAKLSSGSHFVTLEQSREETAATASDVRMAYEEVVQALTDSFKGRQTIVNRAVMSVILGSLPVFFDNIEEVQSYVNLSLSQCRDVAERKACIALIGMILDEA